jgi:hypothetical protein
MKHLLIFATLILSAFASPEKTSTETKRKCIFQKFTSLTDHQTICRWSPTEADGTFLLAIEPGCILLKVEEEIFTDKLCRLRILGSPAGQPMIESAKKKLGITSNLFQIRYVVQKQELEGSTLPSYNKIIKIEDSEKSNQTTKPTKQTKKANKSQ